MTNYSRREFLRLGAAGLGALALSKVEYASAFLPDFPTEPRLGRVFSIVDVKAKPSPDSATIKTVYDDGVLVLQRELIGEPYNRLWRKRIWYETPDGYIPAISVQPVKNLPNIPLTNLPQYGSAPGFWAEVSVPYVDLTLDGEKPLSPKLQETAKPRFYYSMVLWVDGIKTTDYGETLYHVIEQHGSYGDRFWADGRAFKPITPEDVTPISPDISDKSILVDINHQTMSLFENGHEIMFARIASGAKFDNMGNPVEKWSTPIGDNQKVSRKYISLHMAGGESKASGYEEFAVSWNSIFATGGVAIHGTYWHNNYGEMLSHGCVNADPETAKFVYRWTMPETPYDPGKIEVQDYSGTSVKVIEG